jgi:AraC-like DNA-binding protein
MRRAEDPKQIKRRTKRRFKKNDFSGGYHKKWTDEVLFEFLELNDKYIDRELAKHFRSSIPAIQSIRRRINLGKKILKLANIEEYSIHQLHELVLNDEFVLRRKYRTMMEELEENGSVS